MTYPETIKYLFNQLPVYQHVGKSAYKEGLENTLALDSYFRYPHRNFKIIHVGGTNGKGSTSHTIAAILQSEGYKVGLYTSPHLLDFRERIRVNGEKISEEYVIDFVKVHKNNFESIHPSFFELTTLMAFTYFRDEKVDYAVVEVGLGGRLDSTNIVTPILSIITNISLDHTQFLGNTLDKIAFEKAGIIKKHIPVVIGEAVKETRAVFSEKANDENAPIVFAEDKPLIISYKKTGKGIEYETQEYPNLESELGGLAQLKNTNTILTAISTLRMLGLPISKESVYNGFAQVSELTGLMGRWQVIQKHPTVVCDTGHNVGGIHYVTEQLQEETYDKLHIIFGMVNDKDISSVLALLPKQASYYFTKATIARALSETELQAQASCHGLKGTCFTHIADAIDAALAHASSNDFIFIGGSNFVVAEALEAFENAGR